VRATIGGAEARLGSMEFCGIHDDPALARAEALGASAIGFRWGERHCVYLVHQTPRPGAQAVTAALSRMGLRLILLSGDRQSAVSQIAQLLGLHDWRAGMKPADKVAMIEELKRQGRRVLMIGDGINDAPSLAAADVSISPITGADLSQAQADAVFIGEPLTPVLDAVVTARHARALMRQNLWLAVIYNLVAVPVAVAGLVTPLIAAAAMSGSSILVTLNALRARSSPRDRGDRPARASPRTRVLEA
jgi:P-type Cu2+ transporter